MPSRLGFTPEDFAPPWEAAPPAAARAARRRGRRRLQRHLLLHPRRRSARRREPRRRRLLPRRGGLGDALRRRRPRRRRAARRRALVGSAWPARTPVGSTPSRPPTRTWPRPARRASSRSTTSSTRWRPRLSPREVCGSARSTPASASSARTSSRRPAGSARTGTRRTRRLVKDLPGEWRAPTRDAWGAQHSSPVSAVEAWKTRTAVALYDMTPLTRLEVTGPGAAALLGRLSTGKVQRKPGAVTYCLLLDEAGGIRSDVTVARLGPERFQVGRERPPRHRPPDARGAPPEPGRARRPGCRCATSRAAPAASGSGVPWPARSWRASATPTSPTTGGLRYFRCAELEVGGVPVTALRVSYVGELGWELYASAETGQRLWDVLWEAGRPHGMVAAGPRGVPGAAPGEGLPRLGHGHDDGAHAGDGRARLRGAARSGSASSGSSGRRRSRRSPPRAHRNACCAASPSTTAVPPVLGREPVLVDGPDGRLRHQRRVRLLRRPPGRVRVAPGLARRRRDGRDRVLRHPGPRHRRRRTPRRPRHGARPGLRRAVLAEPSDRDCALPHHRGACGDASAYSRRAPTARTPFDRLRERSRPALRALPRNAEVRHARSRAGWSLVSVS